MRIATMGSHSPTRAMTNAHRTQASPMRPRGSNDARYAMRAWWPSVVAYREELRRAVMAIEERRQRRARA